MHVGHVLTFGRGCLSFEREVLAEAYPEYEPSTGKLIRQALDEDTSAHKVRHSPHRMLCLAHQLHELGARPNKDEALCLCVAVFLQMLWRPSMLRGLRTSLHAVFSRVVFCSSLCHGRVSASPVHVMCRVRTEVAPLWCQALSLVTALVSISSSTMNDRGCRIVHLRGAPRLISP